MRALVLLIPAVAATATAAVLLGPGATRRVATVRMYGEPSGGATASVRLVCVAVEGGVEEATPLDGLELRAHLEGGGPDVGAAPVACGSDGVAEARVEGPSSIASIEVRREGTMLAWGAFHAGPPPAMREARPIRGTTRGDGPERFEVTVPRGHLAAPFPEQIGVEITRAGEPASGEAVKVGAEGGDVAPAGSVTLDRRGRAVVVVTPRSHRVVLELDLGAGHWEGVLPVVPGAMWIDPQKPSIVVAQAPRDRAYVSYWDGPERVGGAVVAMRQQADGFYRGDAGAPPASARAVTIAGDPLELGSGTVAWPLVPGGEVEAAVPVLLAEGVTSALAKEITRAGSARRRGAMVVGAAALAEVLLLVLRARAAQRTLDRHVAEVSAETKTDLSAIARGQPVLAAIALLAVLGLGFAVLAALATW